MTKLGLTVSKNGNHLFNEDTFCKYIIKKHNLYFDESNYWIYKNEHLKKISKVELKKICKNEFNSFANGLWKLSYENKYIRSFEGEATLIKKSELNKFPFKLNFKNCVFNFQTQQFEPHDFKNKFTYIYDYEINPTQTSFTTPLFDNFLDTISNNRKELKEYLLKFLAYIISGNKTVQKFFILKGNGQNGKSTLLNLIRKLLTPAFVSNISLKNLNERFALASIEGKKIVISSENEYKNKISTEVLKNLSSGNDLVTIEKKFQDSYSTTIQVELIFAINNDIYFSELSHGLKRRVIVIPFDSVIQNPNPNFESDLEKEIPEIMAKLISIYKNSILGNTFNFPDCSIVNNAIENLFKANYSNNIGDEFFNYFEEYISLNPNAKTSKNDIFSHYRNFGNASHTAFWLKFYKWAAIKKINYEKSRNKIRFISGVELKI